MAIRARYGSWWLRAAALLALAGLTFGTRAQTILFIGNSFTYGYGSPVRFYRPQTVTDLNAEGIGGMPALFLSFTRQAGLPYQVFLETHPGVGLDWHLAHRSERIAGHAWDHVVMHGYSTLDAEHPGDPRALVDTSRRMAELVQAANPHVLVHLMATWSRPDQTYQAKGAWYGKPIDAMAHDVRHGYDLAAAGSPAIRDVIPVGEAFQRAIASGVADGNPYDGIEAGKLDLWTWDGYHASTAGYYLEALVVFGQVTGRDPRSLGSAECSGFELGLSQPQVAALESVAYQQLAAAGVVKPAPRTGEGNGEPPRCH